MSNTAILFTCPGCKMTGQAKSEWSGKKVKCPRCGQLSRVPGPETAPNGTPAGAPVTEVEAPEPAPLEPTSAAAAETLHDIHVKTERVRWEYQVVRPELAADADLATRLTEDMNARGADGWECVGLIQAPGLFLVYKRPRA
jgi:hypothetical protein